MGPHPNRNDGGARVNHTVTDMMLGNMVIPRPRTRRVVHRWAVRRSITAVRPRRANSKVSHDCGRRWIQDATQFHPSVDSHRFSGSRW
jgi:hypothetical protein